MISKAEQYRQACEAMVRAAPPALNLDGGTMYITAQGGVRYARGDRGFVFDAEQSVMVLRWLRATFEPTNEPVTDQRPAPEVPELTEEVERLMVFPYQNTTVWASSEIRALVGRAFRAGALEMARRWREREGK